MTEKPGWSPDKEEALKALIRQTIDAAGTSDPAAIPHRVKERLRGRAIGDLNVDKYIDDVLKERRRNR